MRACNLYVRMCMCVYACACMCACACLNFSGTCIAYPSNGRRAECYQIGRRSSYHVWAWYAHDHARLHARVHAHLGNYKQCMHACYAAHLHCRTDKLISIMSNSMAFFFAKKFATYIIEIKKSLGNNKDVLPAMWVKMNELLSGIPSMSRTCVYCV